MYRIITLTSIPPRFTYLYFNLKELLRNNEVDEIRLYLPKKYRRFPEYRGQDIPVVPAGVTICQIDNDFGPATKLLPAIYDFRNKDVQILFCDDDVFYTKNFSKNLFEIQCKRSDQVIATFGRPVHHYSMNKVKTSKRIYAQEINVKYDVIYRFNRIFEKIFRGKAPNKKPIIFPGYVDILWGVCGAVIRPFFFDDEVFNIPDEAWAVDDVWLSAQLARKNIPIYCPWRLPWPIESRASDIDSLLNFCFLGSARQELNRKAVFWCQKKYGIWM